MQTPCSATGGRRGGVPSRTIGVGTAAAALLLGLICTSPAWAQAPTALPRPGMAQPQTPTESQTATPEPRGQPASPSTPANALQAIQPENIATDMALESACVVLRSTAIEGEQAVTMHNGCDHPVTALGCFRVLRPGGNIQKPGWYCVLAPSFKRRDPITLSRGAIYHPGFKRAGCATTAEQCTAHMQRIAFNVHQSQVDPDKFDQVLR